MHWSMRLLLTGGKIYKPSILEYCVQLWDPQHKKDMDHLPVAVSLPRDSAPPLHTCENPPGVLCPALGPPV